MALEITKNVMNLKVKELFSVPELYIIAVLIIYSAFCLIFGSKLESPLVLLNYNFIVFAVILTVSILSNIYKENRILAITRIIYLAPLIYMMYLNTQFYVKPLNPYLYDNILVNWDRAIFGSDPTAMLSIIHNRYLTELLQVCYVMFFFLPIFHGVELFFRNKNENLKDLTSQIIFGFLLSYLLYFFMPAIGPRFSIYNFSTINTELPGVYVTDFLRHIVNTGGGIPDGVSHPANYVNRDCMPSGHTMLTLINMMLAVKYRSKLRYVILIIGTGLIFSTLYMRYHYGVDVLAGVICAIISYKTEPLIRKLISKKFN
jgi:membrane-associated phospholipid phosphatase